MIVPGKIIPKLNELLTRNHDSEFGYKQAERAVRGEDLSSFFQGFQEKRNHFGDDLKGEILRLGGRIDKGVSIKGDIERFWMRLKSVIITESEQAILSECRKIEMENWEHYNQALAIKNLPEKTREILTDHKANIDEALFKIMELKENYAAA